VKIAVVLFNLGAPDSLDAVEPFLVNLFSDPAILGLPRWLRTRTAKLIAKRRAPITRNIYGKIGGRSPLLEQTVAQAAALEKALAARAMEAKVFIAMRAWNPLSDATARAVAAYGPAMVVTLPLYPQFSTTTSASSLLAWQEAVAKIGLSAREKRVCCYPGDTAFIAALAENIRMTLETRRPDIRYRLLFSAHGLPERIVRRGDPYQWQVERTAAAVMDALADAALDWRVSYQSRVGPLKWLEPATDSEIGRAGAEGLGVIVVPIAFVSEHSETLVELDIDYARLARETGVADYLRVPTVGASTLFIDGLAELVLRAVATDIPVTCGSGRLCPQSFTRCGFRTEPA
jgi:ferrochelatase